MPGATLAPDESSYNPRAMDVPRHARDLAHGAVDALRVGGASALSFDGVDLSGAIEQQLFFAFRDGRPLATFTSALLAGQARSLGRTAAAMAAAAMPRRQRLPPPGGIVFLVRRAIHLEVVELIAARLRDLGGPPVVALLTNGAASTPTPSNVPLRSLASLMHPSQIAILSAFELRGVADRRRLLRVLEAALGPTEARIASDVVLDEVPRIALAAAALRSATLRLRPAVLGAFDEVGTWARILPAVGVCTGIPTIDVPHAEAADVAAICGAGYDRMAVYGPRAVRILEEAGIDPARIAVVGAPRFDPLAALPGTGGPATAPRRVVYAAQYLAGALTPQVMRTSYAAALAVAGSLAPAELLIRPHPAKPATIVEPLVRASPPPEDVSVRIETQRTLPELLTGASAMVTAWSNSVFEAVLLGVPAITVVPPGVPQVVDFAHDGLALHASSPDEAASLAERLRDPQTAAAIVERARTAAERRIGPIDGGASERVARICMEMIDASGTSRSAAQECA